MENEIKKQLDRIEQYTLLAAKNVLCLDDVTLLTGFSKSWLYKATCNNVIPFYRPNGKTLFFDKVEIENWMKQNRVATQQEIDQQAATYLVTGKQKGVRK